MCRLSAGLDVLRHVIVRHADGYDPLVGRTVAWRRQAFGGGRAA